ncbi:MAG TPA: hypothetical protein VOB72_11535 [Candidatus Dormibacteraeota bacterium]|nr:hypothetical protein [Candidatus Dormibacteraeota bacterium]
MSDATDRDRIVELARTVVTELAPEELPIFDPVSERCVRDPERGLAVGRSRDDILGFGVDVAVPLLTPVAVAVAAEVVREVAMRTAGALRRRARPAEAPAPRLTPAQLAEIHAIALGKARAARLGEARAAALADAVVAALAIAP